MQLAKDGKVLNREPYRPSVDFESYLKMRGASDVSQLEELREEQEKEADA